jgi:uncharacterized protein
MDRRHQRLFALYLVLFFAVWTVYVAVLYPRIAGLGVTSLEFALLNIAAKATLWVAPVLLYVHWFDRTDPLAYLQLRAHWRRGLLVGLALTLLNTAGAVARFGPPDSHRLYITWNSVLSASLAVGAIEEVPFRGFILRKLWERYPFWVANVASSALFLAIHLPGWLIADRVRGLSMYLAASVFLTGVILALAVRYSRSLWSGITAHDTNDCLSIVVFHL